MGRNISVMGGAGGGQWPEHRTDNRHWFAIDWLSYKDGMVQSAGERKRERRSERRKKGAPPSEFTLVLSPAPVHCVKSSSVVTPINRPAHLHPDRDKSNDKTVPLQKWKTA